MPEPRKKELKRLIGAKRAPQFVSRRTLCALLDLSFGGLSGFLRRGLLPPPVPGAPADEPRWSWPTVCRWMAGDRSGGPCDLFGHDLVTLGRRRGPSRGKGGRPCKSGGDEISPGAPSVREFVADASARTVKPEARHGR